MAGNEEDSPGGGLGEWVASVSLDSGKTGEIPVQVWRLRPVTLRPSFSDYWKQVWGRRAFIWADAKARAYQTTRGTVLGKIWLVLNPFFNSLIYYFIFALLLQVSRGIPNFVGYLVIGVNFFAVFQNALSSGSQAVVSSKNLIRAFAFPRASVVVAWSLRSFLDFLPVLITTMVFIMAMPPHALPSLRWILIIPIVLLGFVFGNGLALFTAALTSKHPDLKFVWPLLGRFWFYTSGVFFSLDRYANVPVVSAIMQSNPAYVFLTMSRDVLLYGVTPDLSTWLYLTLWAVAMWWVGAVVFWSREEHYGEEL